MLSFETKAATPFNGIITGSTKCARTSSSEFGGVAASQCQVHGGRIGFGSRPTAPALSAAGFVRVEGAAGCCCSVFAGVVVVVVVVVGGGGGLGGAFVASSSPGIVFFAAAALAGWGGGGSDCGGDGDGDGGGGRRRQRLLRLRRRPGRERASECGGVAAS